MRGAGMNVDAGILDQNNATGAGANVSPGHNAIAATQQFAADKAARAAKEAQQAGVPGT